MEKFINVLDEILLDELDYIVENDYGNPDEDNINEIYDEFMSDWGWKGLIFQIGFFKLLDSALYYFQKEDTNSIFPGFNINNFDGSRKELQKLSNSISNYSDDKNNYVLSLDKLANFNRFAHNDEIDDKNYGEFIKVEEEVFNLLKVYILSFHENIRLLFKNMDFINFIHIFENQEKLSYFLRKLNDIPLSKNYFSSLSTFINTVNNFIDKLSHYEFTTYYFDILNQPGRKQLFRDQDFLRDKLLIEFLFANINLKNYNNINIYIPCCDNINLLQDLIDFIKSKNDSCDINFYGKLNFNNSLFDVTKVILYSFLDDMNINLSYLKETNFPFENCSLNDMDFIISDYMSKDIYEDGNFIHNFQYKLDYSLKLVMIIDKNQYSNNYVNFIVLNDNLESIITFKDFFILILNSNKPSQKVNKFILMDYTLLDTDYANNLKQFKKKSLENWGFSRYKNFDDYIFKSFVNFEYVNYILDTFTNFSNTKFSKVFLSTDAVKDIYQFESRKNWGEYYFDSLSEVDEIEYDDFSEVDETEELDDIHDIHKDINFYLENFNYNNLMYELKRKPYSLVKQRYIGNKQSEIVEEQLEFIPLYSLITFDVNDINEYEIETRKIEKYHHDFYIKSDKILRDFLVYYLDSDKGKEENTFLKNGFGFEYSDNRYFQSEFTTRCEFIYMRIPLLDIETQRNIIKAYELNEEHYDLIKNSRDNFKSNILDYEKILKDMEDFNKMEIDTKNGQIVEMSTVKRHMFDGLLWPLSISYLNAVHGTHVSNPNEKLDFYLKLFEFITAFIDIILISSISEEEYDTIKQELWGKFSKFKSRNAVFGTWTTIYSKLIDLYNHKNIKPEFNNVLIDKFLNKDICKIMDEARKIRNEFPAHGTSIRESRAKQLIDDLKLKIDVVYDIFGYFTGFKLFYLVKVLELFDDGSNLYEVVSLNGPCDQPIYGEVTFNKRLKNNSLYLYNSRDGDLLKLNENLILFQEYVDSVTDENGQNKDVATGRFYLYLFNGFSKKKHDVKLFYKCHQIEIKKLPKTISFEDWEKLM